MILRNISCRLTIKLYYILYFERTQHHVSNNERPNTLAATIVCCPSFVFLIYKLLPLIALVLTCCHSIRCYSTSAVTCSLLSNASSMIPTQKRNLPIPSVSRRPSSFIPYHAAITTPSDTIVASLPSSYHSCNVVMNR
jgi:hypothetical protein